MANNNENMSKPIEQMTEEEQLSTAAGALTTYKLANGKFLIAPEGKIAHDNREDALKSLSAYELDNGKFILDYAGKVEHESLPSAKNAIAELDQSRERRIMREQMKSK